MKYPKITIITPSFNQGRYIENTISSVISQNYPHLEYLIADGGSTDNSLEIINKYIKKYPKIMNLISRKDKGQVDAINKGIKAATGDIITYINSDDYYLPGSFNKVGNYFLKHPKSMWIVGNCQVTQSRHRWVFFLKHYWPIDKWQMALEIFNTINQPSTFLTRKLIDKVGMFDVNYDYAFDYDYWLRCNKFQKPDRIFDNLAVFRIHENSKGNSFFAKQFSEDLEIIRRHTKRKLSIIAHNLIKDIAVSSYKILKSQS